jgi:uncharacterized protein (DUF1778 family)
MATAKTPRPKAAPKKKRKAVTKDENLHLRITKDQKALLVEAAEKAGASVSTWVLIVALREARKMTGREG